MRGKDGTVKGRTILGSTYLKKERRVEKRKGEGERDRDLKTYFNLKRCFVISTHRRRPEGPRDISEEQLLNAVRGVVVGRKGRDRNPLSFFLGKLRQSLLPQ